MTALGGWPHRGPMTDSAARHAIRARIQSTVLAHSMLCLRVRDLVARPPITVAPDQPLIEIAKRFADYQIGAMPVVNREGALFGVISYVDVLRTVAQAA
jgi:CBS domain-containing protein